MYLGIHFAGSLSLEDVPTNYVTHWQVFFGYIPDSPQLTPLPKIRAGKLVTPYLNFNLC